MLTLEDGLVTDLSTPGLSVPHVTCTCMHFLSSLLVRSCSKFWCRNRPGDEMKDKYNSHSHPLVLGEEMDDSGKHTSFTIFSAFHFSDKYHIAGTFDRNYIWRNSPKQLCKNWRDSNQKVDYIISMKFVVQKELGWLSSCTSV